jgi:hypothetical protein
MGFVGYITMKKIDQWQAKDYGNNGRIKKTKEKRNMTKMCPQAKYGMFYKFLSLSQI